MGQFPIISSGQSLDINRLVELLLFIDSDNQDKNKIKQSRLLLGNNNQTDCHLVSYLVKVPRKFFNFCFLTFFKKSLKPQ